MEKLLNFFNIYKNQLFFFKLMLEFENKINFEQKETKLNEKKYFLSIIRSFATSGNLFGLIEFINRAIPKVRILFFNYINLIIVL